MMLERESGSERQAESLPFGISKHNQQVAFHRYKKAMFHRAYGIAIAACTHVDSIRASADARAWCYAVK